MIYKYLKDFCNEKIDKITEAIINNPKINQFSELKVQISELEKEISDIKYDTSKVKEWGINDKILSFLSDEDIRQYQKLQDEIDFIKNEIDNLEHQYQSVETKWYKTGPFGDDDDFEEIVTVLDDKLKNELEPKVEELRKRLSDIFKEVEVYKTKARNAYNIDADTRRAKSGLEDKITQLTALKASKDKLLKEISEDSDFSEVIEFIEKSFDKIKLENAGISDKGIFVDVEVSYDVKLEDDDFDENDRLDISEDDVKEEIEDRIEPDESFECKDSNSEFNFKIEDYWIEGDSTISREFTPGVMTLPNGDPGYPDEYDYEISGDLKGLGTIRITKIK